MEINDYLTAEEKQQMEELMKKAAERRKKNKGETDESVSFLYLQCQYESRKQTDKDTAREKADYEAELENLLGQVCGFFQRHGYCDICRRYSEDAGDEELPFG